MNATKRKFNALLNGLGNKPSSNALEQLDNGRTITSPSNEASTKSKRLRGTRTPITLTYVSPAVRSLLDDSTALERMKQKAADEASVKNEAPRYTPWDRTAFLQRLKTFSSIHNWTPKPVAVNEVEWAKRGWVCQQKETVRCALCNVELLVKLNAKEVEGTEEPIYLASEIEDALVQRYSEMIVTSHADSCLWRERGCDETIFKLPLSNGTVTMKSVQDRYASLRKLDHLLPYLHNICVPEDFELDTITTYLPKDFFKPQSKPGSELPEAEPVIIKVALILALFGWNSRPDHMPDHGACECSSCFRTLGLWLFKSKEVDEAGEEIRPAAMDFLDPVGEHREYCPWRNAKAQSSGSLTTPTKGPELAAWQVLVRVLKNEHYLKGSRSHIQEVSRPVSIDGDVTIDNVEAESVREEKEKERWARLRRVKSLFDTKGTRKSLRHLQNGASE